MRFSEISRSQEQGRRTSKLLQLLLPQTRPCSHRTRAATIQEGPSIERETGEHASMAVLAGGASAGASRPSQRPVQYQSGGLCAAARSSRDWR